MERSVEGLMQEVDHVDEIGEGRFDNLSRINVTPIKE